MIGCMAAVPPPARLGAADPRNAQRVRDALFFEHRIEVPVLVHGDRSWARLSMQVYNEESDLERLAVAVDAIDGA